MGGYDTSGWPTVAPMGVPRRVRMKAWMGPFGLFSLLFGGIFTLVGGLISMGFLLVGPPWNDWILDARGMTVQARPSGVRSANLKINDEQVYTIDVRFVDESGGPHEGSLRTRDTTLVEKARQGDALLVEYDPSSPGRLRLEGDRSSGMGWAVLFPLAFAAAGLTVLFFGLRGMLRRRWLLREGAWVTGRVVGVKGTNTRVNNRTVLEVSYLFESPAGERRGKTRVMDAPAMDAEVLVLYDPDAPARNLIALPGAFPG